MDQPQPPPAPVVSPVLPLTTDLACARCGYNLRGLRADHLCPECGTPIERSLAGNLLRFADPAWVDKLRLGVALKLWMMLIALIVGVGGAAASAFGLFVIQAVLSLITGVLGLWALWLITAPEPNVAKTEDPMSLRRLLRACAVIGFFGGQAQTFTGATPGMTPGALPGVVLLGAVGVMMLIGLGAMFGEFVYLRRFARRIPDPKLADNTTVVMWGFCGTMALAITLFAVASIAFIPFAAAAPTVGGGGGPGAPAADASAAIVEDGDDAEATTATRDEVGTTAAVTVTGTGARGTMVTTVATPPNWAMGMLMLFGCGFLVGILVFGIWYIVVLFQYHAALRNVLVEAQHLAQQEHAASPPNSSPPTAPA